MRLKQFIEYGQRRVPILKKDGEKLVLLNVRSLREKQWPSSALSEFIVKWTSSYCTNTSMVENRLKLKKILTLQNH